MGLSGTRLIEIGTVGIIPTSPDRGIIPPIPDSGASSLLVFLTSGSAFYCGSSPVFGPRYQTVNRRPTAEDEREGEVGDAETGRSVPAATEKSIALGRSIHRESAFLCLCSGSQPTVRSRSPSGSKGLKEHSTRERLWQRYVMLDNDGFWRPMTRRASKT